MYKLIGKLEANSESHLRYTTAHEYVNPDPESPQINQQTQTTFITSLQVKDTGAQYSSPGDSSDSDTSDTDTDIEGTENITVAKRYLQRHSLSSEDLYTTQHAQVNTFGLLLWNRVNENQKRNLYGVH